MPVPDRERAEHMRLRLGRTARKAGVPRRDLLEAAHALAMGPRHRLLDDDHDPRYLHPGRTALVAMGDGGVRDAVVLAAGVLLETVSRELTPGAEAVAAALASVPAPVAEGIRGALDVARSVPAPGEESVAEFLVTCTEPLRAVVLSEWLDQLRHLQGWAGADLVARAQGWTREVYLPVAERADPVLARRFRWWIRRVSPGLEGRR